MCDWKWESSYTTGGNVTRTQTQVDCGRPSCPDSQVQLPQPQTTTPAAAAQGAVSAPGNAGDVDMADGSDSDSDDTTMDGESDAEAEQQGEQANAQPTGQDQVSTQTSGQAQGQPQAGASTSSAGQTRR